MNYFSILLLLVTICAFNACTKEKPIEVPAEEYLPGGATTVSATGADAYSFPASNLSSYNELKHLDADGAFGQQFVTAPAPHFGGLGPVFNQNSCEGCHIRNGRSQPALNSDDHSSGFLMRISIAGTGVYGEPLAVPGFGGQLQSKAIYGQVAEGQVAINYIQEVVTYLDGHSVALQRPTYSIVYPYTTLPNEVLLSPRNAPPVYGLGLLEAIPESTILALADENDANGDGISGKPNYGWSIEENRLKLGRFGWKAANPSAIQQTADAFQQDMGITSPYHTTENCQGQSNCNTGTSATPDIDSAFVELTAFYFKTVGVPAPRNLSDKTVNRGKTLFMEAKCNGCHTPKHTTGSYPIAELANQIIYPYTDMLVHDMGADLADNRPDFAASGTEWRTAPLWGIGLTQIVNPKARFLHDGRAATLEQAILWHGGEAEASRNYFKQLSKSDRDAVLAFLNAL